MPQPMAEVFGHRIDDMSPSAVRHRTNRLCPFGNKVPNCTKDRASDPLGVCSVYEGDRTIPIITCPVRFREDWIIADDVADFFFPAGVNWTSLTEVRLPDNHGKSAGNIDLVLVSYDDHGVITDFGSCEIQAVYVSGNIRDPFAYYMSNPEKFASFTWPGPNYPRPDFLSSTRKRLAPQLMFKGGILNSWGKKQAVVVDSAFFNTLPTLPEVPPEEAALAWFVYDLIPGDGASPYKLTKSRVIYTAFNDALITVTVAEPGPLDEFLYRLQTKLNEQLNGSTPDQPQPINIPVFEED